MVVFAASASVTKAVVGVGGAFASIAILIAAQLSRDAGRRIQDQMWESWGGSPTLQRLRYREGRPQARVDRAHAQIEKATGISLPDRHQEEADPTSADETYEDAIADLREITRDKDRFSLLFKENADYGFRRNLLGLRPWGIAVSTVTIVASALLAVVPQHVPIERILVAAVPGVWALVLFAFFLLVVNQSWVRLCAEAYADRLLGAAALIAVGDAETSQAG
jgi:hypothetical protein